MKVWTAVEYEPSEGGDVEGIFVTKEKAIEFACSKLRGTIKRQDYDKDENGILDRSTTYLQSDKEFMKWKIEEWEI